MRKIMAVIGFMLIVWLAGCATYGAKDVMPNLNEPSERAKMATKTTDGLSVSAYLLTEEDEKKYFDEKLSGSDIFTFFVEIQNSAPGDAKLAAVNLKLDGGPFLMPLAKDDVYYAIKRGYAVRTLLGWTFGFYFGGPAMAYQINEKNKEIYKDLGNKTLKLGEIKAGKTTGFLFFKIPSKISDSFRGRLTMVFETINRPLEYVFAAQRQITRRTENEKVRND